MDIPDLQKEIEALLSAKADAPVKKSKKAYVDIPVACPAPDDTQTIKDLLNELNGDESPIVDKIEIENEDNENNEIEIENEIVDENNEIENEIEVENENNEDIDTFNSGSNLISSTVLPNQFKIGQPIIEQPEIIVKPSEAIFVPDIQLSTVPVPDPVPIRDAMKRWLDAHKNVQLFDKIAGLVYGCALGDNLGLPYEGKSLSDLTNYSAKIVGQPQRDYRGINKGDWTDDTDILVLLMDTLTEGGLRFNPMTFAKKLSKWKKTGFPELGDQSGLGISQLTAHVVSKDNFTTDPINAAITAYKDIGSKSAPNGALMRCGIIAVCKNWQSLAFKQCVATHVDMLCIYSCQLLTSMCRSLLRGEVPTLKSLLAHKSIFIKKRKHDADFNKYQRIYELPVDQMLGKLGLGSDTDANFDYTLKGLGAAVYALKCIEANRANSPADYKRIQLEIVNQGGDTDTNAAISGQVLGSWLGYNALPVDWISTLTNKEWLDRKIIKFLEMIIAI